MAYESIGKITGRQQYGTTSGPSGPPPSTLAAQLVENVSSTTTRSSRPDETSELKRLFDVIERIKNQPDLLQSQSERIEHNHMLIYVCARVSLEGPKWDNPFHDRAELQSEALKAVNFFNVTIEETPAVLRFAPPPGSFLFRGEEPLWLWLFPKVLKLLGPAEFSSVQDAIGEFFQHIFSIASRDGGLWDLGPPLIQYVQENFSFLVASCQRRSQSEDHELIEVDLPPEDVVASLGIEQAVRHAIGLLWVIKGAVISKSNPQRLDFYRQHTAWLLDSLISCNNLRAGLVSSHEIDAHSLVQIALDLLTAYLDISDPVDSVVTEKIYTVLAMLCTQLITEARGLLGDDENRVSLRRAICVAMANLVRGAIEHRYISMIISSRLLGPLQNLVSEYPIVGFETDFWSCFRLLKEATESSPPATSTFSVQPEDFTDGQVRRQIQNLGVVIPPNNIPQEEPVTKRVKFSREDTVLSTLCDQVSSLLRYETKPSFEYLLQNDLLGRFSNLNPDEQCQAINILAYVPCATDGTLDIGTSHRSNTVSSRCALCQGWAEPTSRSHGDKNLKASVAHWFASLVRLPAFVQSRRPRVVAMIALRRVIWHSDDPELWDLERSLLGQWCLQSLQSSLRELRIAAGRLLATFLREPGGTVIDIHITRRNRANALAVLKSIADRDNPAFNETCIMAFGQTGKVVEDESLNMTLHKLLEYLGHRNTVISALAFNEILNLAAGRNVTPRQLFEPFWNNLALAAIKDIVSRPQTTRTIADLLQLSVPFFLRLLQHHALPYLVLNKKREVIQKIAEARGEKETWEPCLDANNLPSILAVLLSRDVPDPETEAMKLLREISPHFEKFTFAELLKTEPVMTSVELLKTAGEADGPRKARCRVGLSLLAKLVFGEAEGEQDHDKKNRTGRFFQVHALGLTPRLSDVIDDSEGLHPPVQEQVRCIRAMEEMIIICKSYVRISRPHMSACLLSALASDDLRAPAFSCWQAMLTHMGEEDVEALIETTFFVIGNYWKSFDEATREKARDLITTLLDKYPQTVQQWINKLPPLSHIAELTDLNKKLDSLRPSLDNRAAFSLFGERLSHDNTGVVAQALSELADYLKEHQGYLQTAAMSEQPDHVVTDLMRALLDCASKYSGFNADIGRLCAECVGLVGCLDSNRLETVRKPPQFVAISNFEDANETTDFVAFILEHVLVKSFLAATDTRLIGFLSYTMQELLHRCEFRAAYVADGRGEFEAIYSKWEAFSEVTKGVLIPFMSSRYVVAAMKREPVEYPIIQAGKPYGTWLKIFVLDLLHSDQNTLASVIFGPLSRVIRVTDLSIAEFLLPYLVLHVIVGQEHSTEFRKKVTDELLGILRLEPNEETSYAERETMRQYYEACFRILDYCMRWVQLKKSQSHPKAQHEGQIKRVEQVLRALDPELISKRALDCKQYARALFYLEPHIFHKSTSTGNGLSSQSNADEEARLLQSLSDIYTQIDDPDGLEGVSARLPFVDLAQQTLNHRKAGRWTAAQTWYEIRLAESPSDLGLQLDLLTCLRESGQYDILLNYVEGTKHTSSTINKIIPYAVEASWSTGRWRTLEKYLNIYSVGDVTEVFNLGVAQTLLFLEQGDMEGFRGSLELTREKVASSMSHSTTSSLRAAHDVLLKCHALSELEMIASSQKGADESQQQLLTSLERRLEVLGAYVGDKQYLLGIRRAAMQLMRPKFDNNDISSLWLSTARMARKSGSIHQSFSAVLHAQQLGDATATIENARLLWKDGHHRKAIEMLQGAIKAQFLPFNPKNNSIPTSSSKTDAQANLSSARAHLLLAKWLDSIGQTNVNALRSQYQQASNLHTQWEKGHYYLGRHYKKVMESEKMLDPAQQADEYLTGEMAKLVIENYVRSLKYGTKYLFQTLPRILTLWLELGMQVDNKSAEPKVSVSQEVLQRRRDILRDVHLYIKNNLKVIPAFTFYTALPQMVARIAHPNPEVFRLLERIIIKVVDAHPRQALWSLFACMTTRQSSDRRTRGLQILGSVRNVVQKREGESYSLKQLVRMGEKLAEQLLLACNNGEFQSNRTTMASITRDLNFNHKCTPCPLVVPIESCLTAALPTLTDNLRKHQAFSRDVISIHAFLDEVLVLGSLAKPRKLTARGTDGRTYGLLVKPKDDLRTDQRLMEFNAMINRSLKRDAESSRRQLYIRTYAVTPLNEECGIIEWVDGLKTLRDILLGIYKTRGVTPSYGHIANLMKEAALKGGDIKLFTENVLSMFPPVLPDWFTSQFPSPDTWFSARITYTRSCAVMSMVGTILGLGDRHGENILLEEGNGGVFHVDFNCLFDKGLTFAQPERVPFRLTHNMVAAMGIYGYEGPFRQCSELTLRILRQQEETLMTILEAFIYDPTLDLQRDKKRKHEVIKLQPTHVVENIKRKVRGLLPNESIPLGVEGQVEELIRQATDPRNLTAMYIGWCPFL